MTTPITVMLVDDHAVVREGYRRLLERHIDLKVIAEAADANSAYEQFVRVAPDVVVLDISLPVTSGIDALRRIRARSEKAQLLAFSMHEDAIFIERALDAGALGYVTKASAPEVLVEAVRSVAAGRRYLSADATRALSLHAGSRREALMRSLSAREFEVLRLIVLGETLEDIARDLHLSVKTVANHQSSIKAKLAAENLAQVVRIAQRLALVPGSQGN